MLDGRWWDLGGQAVPDTIEDEHLAAIVSTTRAMWLRGHILIRFFLKCSHILKVLMVRFFDRWWQSRRKTWRQLTLLLGGNEDTLFGSLAIE